MKGSRRNSRVHISWAEGISIKSADERLDARVLRRPSLPKADHGPTTRTGATSRISINTVQVCGQTS